MLYKQTNKHHTIKSLALLCSLSLMFGCSPDINHATGMPNETSILSIVQTKMNQSSFEVYTGRVAISLNPGMTGHSKRDAISFVQSESFQIQAQKKAKPNPALHKQVQTAFQSSTLSQVFVASLLVDENGALSADGTYGPFAAKVRIKACTP